jgi:hypothetical protein
MFLMTPSPEERYQNLVLPHVPLLYRMALRYAGSDYDAEDLVRERADQLEPARPSLKLVAGGAGRVEVKP